MRRRFLFDRNGPALVDRNRRFEQFLQRGMPLVNRERETLEAVHAIGQGLRGDVRLVNPEPAPNPHAELAAGQPAGINTFVRMAISTADDPNADLARAVYRQLWPGISAAYEIVKLPDRIDVRFCLPAQAVQQSAGLLMLWLPNSELMLANDSLTELLDATRIGVAEYALMDYPAFPIQTRVVPSALARFCAVFETRTMMRRVAFIQILLQACQFDWIDHFTSLAQHVLEPGTVVMARHLPQTRDLEAKADTDGFYAVTLRIGAGDGETMEAVNHAFIRSFTSRRQGFVWNQRRVSRDDVLGRFTRSEGLLLNADELAALCALPGRDVRSSFVDRPSTRRMDISEDFEPWQF